MFFTKTVLSILRGTFWNLELWILGSSLEHGVSLLTGFSEPGKGGGNKAQRCLGGAWLIFVELWRPHEIPHTCKYVPSAAGKTEFVHSCIRVPATSCTFSGTNAGPEYHPLRIAVTSALPAHELPTH